jgi:phosphohistidine swiveling domain-containing protein
MTQFRCGRCILGWALLILGATGICCPAKAQSYDDLVRRPDQFRGQSVQLTGKVIQSLQDGEKYVLRVNVTQEKFGWKDTVLVAYKNDSRSDRIVEGDIIDISGTSNGITSYKAVLGQTIQLPSIAACRITPHGGGKFVSPGGSCL